MVWAGERILAEGSIDMPDLSTSDGRSFEAKIDLDGIDLTGQAILWRFRGEVYDATLDKTFGPMAMRSTEWSPSLTSVGYRFVVSEGGGFRTEEQVGRTDASQSSSGTAWGPLPLPHPGGPSPVGVRSHFWVDGDRGEPLTSDPDDKRHLLVTVWYPAQDTILGGRAPYIHDPDAFGGISAESSVARVQTNSFINAPLSGERRRYPVLIFSHGMGATRFSSTFLMEHLASSGYVVFSIGHTFFNGVEVFPDGYRAIQDVIPDMTPTSSQEEGYREFSELVFRNQVVPMALDTRFVLDRVESIDRDRDSFFGQRLDLDHVGVLGWSAGGVSAAHVLRSDPRVKAGANLDGTLDAVVADEGVGRPFLVLKGEHAGPAGMTDEFRVMVEQLKEYETEFVAHSGQVFVMSIAGASHMDFSDGTLLDAASGNRAGTLRLHEIVRALTLAFFDRYLMEKDSVDLMDLARSYPEVVVR